MQPPLPNLITVADMVLENVFLLLFLRFPHSVMKHCILIKKLVVKVTVKILITDRFLLTALPAKDLTNFNPVVSLMRSSAPDSAPVIAINMIIF